LPTGSYCNDVQQKDQQIIRVPRFRRQRFVMNNFKVNQSRPVSLPIVDNIAHSCIAVRPRAAEFVAPQLMRLAQLAARCFQHPTRQRAFV